MDPLPLIETIEKQNEILSEFWDLLVRQREALKGERLPVVQELMAELRNTATRAQAVEIKRERLAARAAEELGCEPRVFEIARRLPAEEGERLTAVGKRLLSIVAKLRAENNLFRVLLDETRLMNDILISEWRRLSEDFPHGPMGPAGGFDTRI